MPIKSPTLVLEDYRIYCKPDAKYARLELFISEEDGFPYTVYNQYFKTRVLPTLLVKREELESYKQILAGLMHYNIEILYNEYGSIKELRSC